MKKEKIKQLLPEVIQETISNGDQQVWPEENLLAAFLEVMEKLHRPSEEIFANLSDYFDPLKTKRTMVPYLARWYNLAELLQFESLVEEPPSYIDPTKTHNLAIWEEEKEKEKKEEKGLENLRKLTANVLNLFARRGSSEGLRIFLDNATGEDGFKIEDKVTNGEEIILFHIRVTAPLSVQKKRYLIKKIIEREKPAYVTYELVFS